MPSNTGELGEKGVVEFDDGGGVGNALWIPAVPDELAVAGAIAAGDPLLPDPASLTVLPPVWAPASANSTGAGLAAGADATGVVVPTGASSPRAMLICSSVKGVSAGSEIGAGAAASVAGAGLVVEPGAEVKGSSVRVPSRVLML